MRFLLYLHLPRGDVDDNVPPGKRQGDGEVEKGQDEKDCDVILKRVSMSMLITHLVRNRGILG